MAIRIRISDTGLWMHNNMYILPKNVEEVLDYADLGPRRGSHPHYLIN